MNLKIILIIFFLMLMNCKVYAAFNGLTHHSRANCINNESISWDWTKNWWLWVNSDHINANTGAIVHTISSGWALTWRQAAVHWGEGHGGWKVHGSHWMKDIHGNPVLVQEELVTDCSIYDGWWDKTK